MRKILSFLLVLSFCWSASLTTHAEQRYKTNVNINPSGGKINAGSVSGKGPKVSFVAQARNGQSDTIRRGVGIPLGKPGTRNNKYDKIRQQAKARIQAEVTQRSKLRIMPHRFGIPVPDVLGTQLVLTEKKKPDDRGYAIAFIKKDGKIDGYLGVGKDDDEKSFKALLDRDIPFYVNGKLSVDSEHYLDKPYPLEVKTPWGSAYLIATEKDLFMLASERQVAYAEKLGLKVGELNGQKWVIIGGSEDRIKTVTDNIHNLLHLKPLIKEVKKPKPRRYFSFEDN